MSAKIFLTVCILGAMLGFACKQSGDEPAEKCSPTTKCPHGYECDYKKSDPNHPKSLGECKYKECGLTDLCAKSHESCPFEGSTALCDRFKKDKLCECIQPNAQEVPTIPTTGGSESGS